MLENREKIPSLSYGRRKPFRVWGGPAFPQVKVALSVWLCKWSAWEMNQLTNCRQGGRKPETVEVRVGRRGSPWRLSSLCA